MGYPYGIIQPTHLFYLSSYCSCLGRTNLQDSCCRQVWIQSGLSHIVLTWGREKLAEKSWQIRVATNAMLLFLVVAKLSYGRVKLEHPKWCMSDNIYEKSQFNSLVWGLLTLAPINKWKILSGQILRWWHSSHSIPCNYFFLQLLLLASWTSWIS